MFDMEHYQYIYIYIVKYKQNKIIDETNPSINYSNI